MLPCASHLHARIQLSHGPAGKTGTLNGMLGGGAAGAVLGARMGKLTYGVGAGFALAFTSALVDTTGGKLVGDGLIDDGATPPRIIYPYTHNGR